MQTYDIETVVKMHDKDYKNPKTGQPVYLDGAITVTFSVDVDVDGYTPHIERLHFTLPGGQTVEVEKNSETWDVLINTWLDDDEWLIGEYEEREAAVNERPYYHPTRGFA